MDPVANPYTPNAGAKPPELAGRGAEITAFRTLVGRLAAGTTEKSLIVTGLRGVGKTVLLNAFEGTAESAGFHTSFRELDGQNNLTELITRDVQSTLEDLSLAKRLVEKFRGSISGRGVFRLKDPHGFELTVDLRRLAEQSSLADDLTELFLGLGEVLAAKKTGFIIFIDELQFVEEYEFRALISALHRVTQKALPISMAAAGLPQIPRLAGEARSYAERLFDFPVIGRLSEGDATAALVNPARLRGVEYAPDAVEQLLRLTEGYPFYLQELGKHTWNVAAGSPITVSDVDRAAPLAIRALDQTIYEVRIQRATAKERRYMRAMAELGRGPYRTGAVAAKMGAATTSLSPLRQHLIDKGLIYATEDYGHLDFTIPRFDEFMRRHMEYRPPAARRRKRASS